MNKLFLLILCIFFVSSSLFAISKKESLYQEGKPLDEWSESAGWNSGWLSSCAGGNGSKIAKGIRKQVAMLSWPDYKKFSHGKSRWDLGNYRSAKCTQSDFDSVKNELNDYIEYLEFTVNQEVGKNTNSNDLNNVDNSKTKSNSKKSIETKLLELKKLYDSGLISEAIYEKKQLEILE